jgi:very-short-patch-repair endonuclease
MRQKYSETAKKTSARPEIQKARAIPLKKWREKNPEKFQEIIIKAQSSPKKDSRMEVWLIAQVKHMGFVRNTRIDCSGSKKQIDLIHRDSKTIIEVDGVWHFLPIHGTEVLEKTQKRDRMLDAEIIKRSWRLIRLSMENFNSHTGELGKAGFTLFQLLKVIQDLEWTGVRCYGSLYESLSWGSVKVTILK